MPIFAVETAVETKVRIPHHGMLGTVWSGYANGGGGWCQRSINNTTFLLSFCVAFSYDEERAVARKGSRVGEISGRRRKRRISTWRPDRMNGVNASLKSNRSPRFLNRAVR